MMPKLSLSFSKNLEKRVGERDFAEVKFRAEQARKKRQLEKLRHFIFSLDEPNCLRVEQRKAPSIRDADDLIVRRMIHESAPLTTTFQQLQKQRGSLSVKNGSRQCTSKTSVPRSLRFSTNHSKESLFAVKNLMRQQVFDHNSYRPELNEIRSRKLLKNVIEDEAEFKSPEQLNRTV